MVLVLHLDHESYKHNFIFSSDADDDCSEESSPLNSTEEESEENKKISDEIDKSSSFTTENKTNSFVSLTFLAQVQNHLTFNFSDHLFGHLCNIFNESVSYLSSSSSKIMNYLGQESEIRYSSIKDGEEVNLIRYPEEDIGNSSE